MADRVDYGPPIGIKTALPKKFAGAKPPQIFFVIMAGRRRGMVCGGEAPPANVKLVILAGGLWGRSPPASVKLDHCFKYRATRRPRSSRLACSKALLPNKKSLESPPYRYILERLKFLRNYMGEKWYDQRKGWSGGADPPRPPQRSDLLPPLKIHGNQIDLTWVPHACSSKENSYLF